MTRNTTTLTVLSLLLALSTSWTAGCDFSGLPQWPGTVWDNSPGEDPEDDSVPDDSDSPDGEEPSGGNPRAGTLQVKIYTDSLAEAGRLRLSGQARPDDIDVNLTPLAYTIAFKRLVIKFVDQQTGEVANEVELFAAESVENAILVDLANGIPADLLQVESLPASEYNKLDIEVFYLDMTLPTVYPAAESHDICYRMVFDTMGVLQPRDLLLWLVPGWMEPGSPLADRVATEGWYWMAFDDPDLVAAVDGADAHPDFHVLDLFANEDFWSAEHRVLEGGGIAPALQYDPAAGGVVTLLVDVTNTFTFKDYHDETTDPDGLWEIRRDAGIHPFTPQFLCVPGAPPVPGP